jgi:hypothetical protein
MQIIFKFKLISLLNYATNKTKNKENPQQFSHETEYDKVHTRANSFFVVESGTAISNGTII